MWSANAPSVQLRCPWHEDNSPTSRGLYILQNSTGPRGEEQVGSSPTLSVFKASHFSAFESVSRTLASVVLSAGASQLRHSR